jgi:hypothetical protein
MHDCVPEQEKPGGALQSDGALQVTTVRGMPLIITVEVPCEAPNPVPEITKPIWTGPSTSDKPVIEGVTAKGTALLAVPFTVTTTFALPGLIPVGTGTTMLVELQLVGVAAVPPKVTALDPCEDPKLAPLIVTGVPTGPAMGERLVIAGPDPTTKGTPLLGIPPTVTTTFPVAAPVGTGATIVVALQLVGVAVVPLKVTVLDPCEDPKFVPEIVIEVPTAPAVGLKLEIPGEDPTTKSTPLLEKPLTVTTTFPVVAPDGTVTAMLAALQLVGVAKLPLKVTTPGTDPKFVPVIVTGVATIPEVGFKLVITGAGKTTEKFRPLLATPPTVTTTPPVVAPVGTGTTMPVALQLVGVAAVPLNVIVLEPCAEPKFAPVIVTEVPTLPDVGLRLMIPGPDPTTKTLPLLARPPTVTTTIPVVAPVGTAARMLVALQLVGVAAVPLKVTVLDPCVEPKFVPVIVTEVPMLPEVGLTLVMLGKVPTVNKAGLLASPPTVTTTLPVVAPEGTGTTIAVAPQLVGDATVPLNVIVLVPCVEPKLVPAIVTEVPTGPAVGERDVMPGPTRIVNTTPLLAVPLTVTRTFPVLAPVGTGVTILVELQLVGAAGAPLNVTLLAPWVDPKFAPVIVTEVPTGPPVGERPVTVGADPTVKFTPLLAIPPTVTTTLPVVAPVGTGATILVALQLVGVAVVPLNLTVLAPWVDPKLAPVIVTEVPTFPDAGLSPVIPGPVPTTKTTPLLDSPPTVTKTAPVVAPLGTGTAMLVALQLVGVAGVPLNATVLCPWVDPKFDPEIVTDVPTEPESGDKEEITGCVPTVKSTPLLASPPTVTTTFPEVAPLGTGTTMLVELQLVAVATVPLNVTVLDACVDPKLVPVIVTEVPTGPEPGEMPVMIGADTEVTTKVMPLLARPPTVTTTLPVVAPLGTGATIVFELQLVGVVGIPLNVTVLVPCVEPKFVPPMVTDVPSGPEDGDRLPMSGAMELSW